MAPFADTVRFVDCYARKLSLGMNNAKNLTKVVPLAKFRRYIEETCERVATLEVCSYSMFVGDWCRTIYGLYFDTGMAHGSDLVVLVLNERSHCSRGGLTYH